MNLKLSQVPEAGPPQRCPTPPGEHPCGGATVWLSVDRPHPAAVSCSSICSAWTVLGEGGGGGLREGWARGGGFLKFPFLILCVCVCVFNFFFLIYFLLSLFFLLMDSVLSPRSHD